MGQKVDDGSRVVLGAAHVLLTGLRGDEGPATWVSKLRGRAVLNIQLLDVDGRGPLLVAQEMES